MSEVDIKLISYGQLGQGDWLTDNDRYGLAAFVDDNVTTIFLNSPFNKKPEKTAVMLAVDGGDVVGRHLLYGTQIKAGNQIINAQSSGSTEVDSSQRGKGIGSKINKYTLTNDEYPVYICSLLSPACLSIMRKPEYGCTIFDLPQYVKLINVAPKFKRLSSPFLQKCLASLANSVMAIIDLPNRHKLKKIRSRYRVSELREIPFWVTDMCLKDGHKYAEVHNREWLQWCLDYNLSGKPEDSQHFYAIYDNSDKPVGFFLTKVRLLENIGKLGSFRHGVLCEWASEDMKLTEADINLLAWSTYPSDCYHATTITENSEVARILKRRGFLRHGSHQMGFRDKLDQFPDMSDISNWRIRFGCCNSILY